MTSHLHFPLTITGLDSAPTLPTRSNRSWPDTSHFPPTTIGLSSALLPSHQDNQSWYHTLCMPLCLPPTRPPLTGARATTLAPAKMVERAEFYLSSIWIYRRAGADRILSDLRSLNIVSLSGLAACRAHRLTPLPSPVPTTRLCLSQTGSGSAVARVISRPSKRSSGMHSWEWRKISTSRRSSSPRADSEQVTRHASYPDCTAS